MKRKKVEIDFDWICPECHGPLKELRNGELARFRCRVGHEYSSENLLQAHGDSMERALWAAVQVMEERAQLLLEELVGGEGDERQLVGGGADEAFGGSLSPENMPLEFPAADGRDLRPARKSAIVLLPGSCMLS